MPRNWFLVSLTNFFLAAILGTMLRYFYVGELPGVDFTNLMHAHSHTAMLGWVYLALFTLLIKYFLPQKEEVYKKYRVLFWLTQTSVAVMFISFIIQGYGTISIVASSAHSILAYIFIIKFWKDLKKTNNLHRISFLFARTSLIFLVVSTLALWTMPVIIAQGFRGSAWYYGAVQFYLHFQFNGWFIFAVIALLFYYMEDLGIRYSKTNARKFFILLALSCVLTFVLAITWSTPLPILFLINSIGVIIQLAALYMFIRIIKPHISQIFNRLPKVFIWLLGFAMLCFLLKILVQSAVVIPFIAKVGYTIRIYVIGFLHLLLLGMISSSILFFAAKGQLLKITSKAHKSGVVLFFTGFILSELYLFSQGTLLWASLGFMPFYHEGITIVSAFIPLGIGFILFNQNRSKRRL